MNAKDVAEVEATIEELVRTYDEKFPGNSPEKVVAFRQAAEAYRKLQMPGKASPIYEKILAILRETEGRRPSLERVDTLMAVVTTYGATGLYRETLAPAAEAVSILKTHFPERTADLYTAMNNIASSHLGMDELQQAEKLYLEILSLSDTVLKANKESIAATHHQLGALYFRKKDYLGAEEELRLALVMKKQLFGESHYQVGMTLHNLAVLYGIMGHQEASRMLEEAKRIMARVSPRLRLRFVDPGERAQELVGPFLAAIQKVGFAVDNISAVTTDEIYQEGILPPIVTLFIDRSTLETAPMSQLAASLADLLARFHAAGILGYGSGANLKRTNDAGIFVSWSDTELVRYYIPVYEPAALATISGTVSNVGRLVDKHAGPNRPSLHNLLLWRENHWRWFEPGATNLVPVD